ncbi:MAG: hypothetical protein ABIJ09_20375 [Pseudomonadota bacterium]
MATTPDLGRDVDTWCSRCQLDLAHTVIAKLGSQIKRVRCNTCKNEHAFRAPAGEKVPRARRDRDDAQPRPRTRAVTSQYQTLLGDRSTADARDYSSKMALAKTDIVRHPSFGVGVVSAVKSGNKAEVVFAAGVKVLIFGR